VIDHRLPELLDPSRRRPLREDLRRIWSRRDFVWYSALSELRTQQTDTVLGNVWHLLNPALQISVYFVVFGLILGTDRGIDNFLPFLFFLNLLYLFFNLFAYLPSFFIHLISFLI
jgi:teichoic acid transport system permease protein